MNSLIAKFRLKLKKVGETTRPFRYDLNQIQIGSYLIQSPMSLTKDWFRSGHMTKFHQWDVRGRLWAEPLGKFSFSPQGELGIVTCEQSEWECSSRGATATLQRRNLDLQRCGAAGYPLPEAHSLLPFVWYNKWQTNLNCHFLLHTALILQVLRKANSPPSCFTEDRTKA